MATGKLKALKIVNPIIAVLFIGQALSGIFHGVIPWEIFEKVHGTVGYFLAAGVTVHFILNWNWIKTNFLKPKPVG
ncbi:MAG: hypothetical protein JW863_17440 [Chitinispirillaceae bacterium]|nr:hypothetical protein [Chitinispirillaceae bacterium]